MPRRATSRLPFIAKTNGVLPQCHTPGTPDSSEGTPADGRHGYGLLQEVANLTEGELQLEPGTLYRALHRMLKDGWVVESPRRPAADLDDERRRYYRLTEDGRQVAVVEAIRMEKLLARARSKRLLKAFKPA